jgi:polysaccharide export outer membrane protein
LLVGLPSFAQETKQDAKPPAAATTPAKTPAASATATDYVIGTQDVISINVWHELEVSVPQVPVRPDGKISLPLLNDVEAAGLTPAQLTENITQQLKRYIAEPRVTVTVVAMNSQRFFVMGEVARPGGFPLLPNTTVLQGLSNGGGFTEMADPKKIYVLRKEAAGQQKLPFNYREVVKGRKPEQNILLRPGDTIVVP